MKASEWIENLQVLISEHGDLELRYNAALEGRALDSNRKQGWKA